MLHLWQTGVFRARQKAMAVARQATLTMVLRKKRLFSKNAVEYVVLMNSLCLSASLLMSTVRALLRLLITDNGRGLSQTANG